MVKNAINATLTSVIVGNSAPGTSTVVAPITAIPDRYTGNPIHCVATVDKVGGTLTLTITDQATSDSLSPGITATALVIKVTLGQSTETLTIPAGPFVYDGSALAFQVQVSATDFTSARFNVVPVARIAPQPGETDYSWLRFILIQNPQDNAWYDVVSVPEFRVRHYGRLTGGFVVLPPEGPAVFASDTQAGGGGISGPMGFGSP